MSKFKVGPAKTRDGLEARVYAFVDGCRRTIHGAFVNPDGVWECAAWYSDGRLWLDNEGGYDLLPNVEPVKVEFISTVIGKESARCTASDEGSIHSMFLKDLVGKKVSVIVEEIVE